VEIAPSQGNPNTSGSARADTLFKVGDQFVYRTHDLRQDTVTTQTQTVTSVSDLEVVFNNGRAILDPLGNLIQSADGRRYTPRQEVPLEYIVGKRWSTRFDVIGDRGTADFDFRIAGRETITVPAGSFDCFRIEGRGVNTHTFRPPVDISLTFWRAPAQVRRHIRMEEKKWHRQQVTSWERRELVSYRQT